MLASLIFSRSLEATSESSVTPYFGIDLDIRATPTGSEVYNADVGDALLLVLIIPGKINKRLQSSRQDRVLRIIQMLFPIGHMT